MRATLIHKRFVTVFLLTAGLACLSVLGLNLLVDPLWYFKGNILTGKNEGFNEREAKLNQLLRNPQQYDCLIFGSSRTTWMPAPAFQPMNCFNLSFSSGQPREFIAYARYLKMRGMNPHYLIVGVDGFVFQEYGKDPVTLPAHVSSHDEPENFYVSYLSYDSLSLSIRTLFEDRESPGYYDAQFIKTLQNGAPAFNPDRSLEVGGLRRADAEARRKSPFSTASVDLYRELASVFPGSRTLAYVPPVSLWHIAEMERNGILDGYTRALHATAAVLPVFRDFSIPSATTADPRNTYDGSHYLPQVNHQIGRMVMSNTPPEWGVDVKPLTLDQYRARYHAALDRFRPQLALSSAPQTAPAP
jgi:hypothetical protein